MLLENSLIVLFTEARKILKPDRFQEFELKEKTILTHNTAM
jgi:cytochrome-b5 reductase